MELSEAKDILQNIIADEVIGTYCLEIQKTVNCEENCKNSDCYLYQAIDTVLKALDNKYFEMVLKEQDDIINNLKNRLDNSISKDEVRKLSNDAFEVNTHEYGTLFVVPYDNIQELLGE